MLRLGIVGTESSHCAEFLTFLRSPEGAGAAQLAAVWPGAGEPVEGADIVGRPEELPGRVDAVALFARDAREHLELAAPLLSAGLRVFVDKPLAASVADAERLLELAARHGGAVTSFSALRWAPEVLAWSREVARARREGTLLEVGAAGGANPNDPHAGAWFYGVHPVDMLASAVGGSLLTGETTLTHQPGLVESHWSVDGIELGLRLEANQAAPFGVWWAARDGSRKETVVPVGAGYFTTAAERILAFLSGNPGVGPEECLAVVARTQELVATLRPWPET